MSLSTRCPSCATTFKVVPDQLKVSEGWVRCGQCGEVFDATADLRPLDAGDVPPGGVALSGTRQASGLPSPASVQTPLDAGPPAAAAASGSSAVTGPATAAVVSDGRAPASADGGGTADAALAQDPSSSPHTKPGAMPEAPPAPAVWMRRSPAARVLLHGEDLDLPALHTRAEPEEEDEDDPLRAVWEAETSADRDSHRVMPGADEDLDGQVPSALLLQTADTDEPQQSLYQPAFVPPDPPAGTPEADAEAEDAAQTLRALDFVRVAERRAFWQRPLVVLASLLACLLLAAVLVLQFAYSERDRLAAHLPGLKPALQSLCGLLRCEIAPLRRIDAVVIDASSFNKAGGGLFQFEVDLRNTAPVAVAMPALELTLTDTQDRPLLRRVLQPAELRAPGELGASGAWRGSLPVRLVAPLAADGVAGYRLLAFYP